MKYHIIFSTNKLYEIIKLIVTKNIVKLKRFHFSLKPIFCGMLETGRIVGLMHGIRARLI